MKRATTDAQARLDHGPPVAVIDIGSNSVRLVVYEGLTRSPTELFNEKALCGLGREVQSTGLLAADAVEHALGDTQALPRAVRPDGRDEDTGAVATAACRDAKNGAAFIRFAERMVRAEIDVLSGAREAELTALGVISGVHRADGVVGDLGGGSLELVDVRGTRARHGLTRPLGGLALADISAKSVKKAEKFVKKTLSGLAVLKGCEDRSFYAVGGTWRSLARLHMWQTGYPLHVMHGYAIPADEALEFARLVHRVEVDTLVQYRRGEQCAAAAAAVFGAGARIHLAHRQAAAGGVLRARRARGPALLAAQAQGTGKGCADRGGAAISTSCARARRAMARS